MALLSLQFFLQGSIIEPTSSLDAAGFIHTNMYDMPLINLCSKYLPV